MEKKTYFISYTNRTDLDKQWAAWAEWFFRVRMGGITIMQEYDFHPGDNFRSKMHNALKESDFVVCVLSHAYLGSEPCEEEWTNAERIIPLKFDDCKPDGLLNKCAYIDLFKLSANDAIVKLEAALEEKIRPADMPTYGPYKEAPAFTVAPAFPKNNLPARNPRFTGRAAALEEIHTELRRYHIVLVTGQGGYGKTETAVEYAYRHAYDYDWVWYFNAESEMRLKEDYREFAVETGLSEEAARDSGRVMAHVSKWFRDNNCLFLYDNAEGCPDLGRSLPVVHSHSHILINSRIRLYGIGADWIDAHVFSPGDAAAFVKTRVPDAVDADAEKLVKTLGYLPLALEQAVSYMGVYGYDCRRYLKLYEKNSRRLLATAPEDTTYDKTVATTWDITFEALEKDAEDDPEYKAAAQLLSLLAYCAPDDIPLSLFIAGREELPEALRAKLDPDDELSNNDVVKKLTDRSLVTMRRDKYGAQLLSMHRLIQDVLAKKQGIDTEWLIRCLDAAVEAFNYTYGDRESFDQFSETLPHALAIARHTEELLREDEEQLKKAASLYHEAGRGLEKAGDYDAALEWFGKALAIREKVLGKNHPDTAVTYDRIATVHQDNGDYDTALEWFGKALEIWEKVLGKEHPDTATGYNNIGLVYNLKGDYDAALEWYGKALEINEKVLGKEHPSIAVSYNNIASTYFDKGDYDAALEWYGKALAVKEKVLGEEHPSTATTYNNIGLVYRLKGDNDAALEWFGKALAIDEKVLGKEHPDTATTYNNIAGIHHDKGDYAASLEWYGKALVIRNKKLGSSHPDTKKILKNMLAAYLAAGHKEKDFEGWLIRTFPPD